jgi:hypothetical protein
MPRKTVFEMKVSEVYPLLVQKAERKGRSKAEVDQVTAWLTGYDMEIANLIQRIARWCYEAYKK